MDLTRHYFGRKKAGDGDDPPRPVMLPLGGKGPGDSNADDLAGIDPADSVTDMGEAELWYKFHECVQSMPDNEREVVELLWYQELTQEEAAELLSVDRSTVKRRWRAARKTLFDVLKGWLPNEPGAE
jgi:RNA polymerase sigma factor (sigma-70 family)